MELSRHVIKTTAAEQKVYYNTVTKSILPIDIDQLTLQQHFCLAGQEEDALRSVLLNKIPHQGLGLSIAVTWACNLRCTHCVVKHKLLEDHHRTLDIGGVCDFVKKCADRYHLKIIYLRLSGGESLLALGECIELIAALSKIVTIDYSLYTNLTLPLTPQHMSFFDSASAIGVSIDGLEEQHNRQRKPLTVMDNPFQTTLQNLKQLVLAGLRDKIKVQACLSDDSYNLETRREFYRLMLQHGIKSNNINIGIAGPSKSKPMPGDLYINSLGLFSLVNAPCCKYRSETMVIDNNGDVLSDYYSMAKLGTIYDDLATIESKQNQLILDTAPPFTDPKCRHCDVIAYCWGGCSFVENTGYRLSKYCDKRKVAIQQRIAEYAESGVLTSKVAPKHDQDIH